MDFSPAVGILFSFSPRGSPSPPAVSGDDVRGYNTIRHCEELHSQTVVIEIWVYAILWQSTAYFRAVAIVILFIILRLPRRFQLLAMTQA